MLELGLELGPLELGLLELGLLELGLELGSLLPEVLSGDELPEPPDVAPLSDGPDGSAPLLSSRHTHSERIVSEL